MGTSARRLFFSSIFICLALFYTKAHGQLFNMQSMFRGFFETASYWGDGSDGAWDVDDVNDAHGPLSPHIINTVVTHLTADAAANASSITVASTAGLAIGDEILIIQMDGANAGTMEFVDVDSLVLSPVISLSTNLKRSYTSADKVQVIRVPQYTNVTLDSGEFLSAPQYDSATGEGGVIVFKANGTLSLDGGGGGLPAHITLGGGEGVTFGARGFEGGISGSGEGPGAGGGNLGGSSTSPGTPSFLAMGSGGSSAASVGGDGGGLIIIKAKTIHLEGNIYSKGDDAAAGNAGGGAGGTVAIFADDITDTGGNSTNCGTINADKGLKAGTGTNGEDGRIFILHNSLNSTLKCTTTSPAGNTSLLKMHVY